MSYGESILKGYLENMVEADFVCNHRPEWLKGLEIDFFFPSEMVGIEFQGDHHYCPTDYCQDFWTVRQNDRNKRFLCRQNGVKLARIDAVDLEYTRLVGKLRGMVGKGFTSKEKIGRNKPALRSLNRRAIEYRKTLVASFNSVSARRKHSKVRKEAQAARRLCPVGSV